LHIKKDIGMKNNAINTARSGESTVINRAKFLVSSIFPSPILFPIIMAEPLPIPKKITHNRRETLFTMLKAAYSHVPRRAKIRLCVVIPKDQHISSKTTGIVTKV